LNIARLLEQRLQKTGQRTVAFFEGREIVNREIHDRGGRLGNALKELGVRPGDIVAVTMSNCPEVLESFAALLRLGTVLLPVLFVLTPQELRYILADSQAVAVITDFTLEQKVLEATADLDSVKHIIVVGAQGTSRVTDYEGLMDKSSPVLDIADKAPDDPAMVIYTAGTTANPKGVVLTHNNLLESTRSSYEVNETGKPRNVLLCLPLSHMYGVMVMNTGAFSELDEGIGVIMRWFDTEGCCSLIQEYKINVFPGVPAMFAMLLRHPALNDYDLSSLEDCITAAAPLSMDLRRDFAERFGFPLRELYGLTEACGMGTATRPGQPFPQGSVGKAYPGMKVAIFDVDDNELPAGQTGEIVMRGPHVMKGYLNMPEETASVLRGGWLHTGDIGYLDDQGYLYVTDRTKDIIIRGGENVSPAGIEEVVYRHPAIAEAAVIGVEDEVYGEEIIAYVSLVSGRRESSSDLLDYCESQLPSFKRPREVIIMEALPRSSVGKVLKRELKRMYKEERDNQS
jgi:long-chain acyl-CoA synthetase